MDAKNRSTVVAAGMAMFSMFFGAGNVIFPLAVGRDAGNLNLYAISGLLLSAVGIPLVGLISATLFNGNYKHYFERIGKIPGFFLALFIMGLIGPFGAMPRLITVSHLTLSIYWPDVTFWVFSLIACAIVFLCTFKKNRLIDILGYFLTPALLIVLVIIIAKGLFSADSLPVVDKNPGDVFFNGLITGYEMMDLLATFFFSSIVLKSLESVERQQGHTKNFRNVIFLTLKASLIGMGLLAFIYIGFSYVAAFHGANLTGLGRGDLLGAVALQILGSSAGIIAILAVSLACLTTAIALAAVFAEFLTDDLTQGKLPYVPSLVITLLTCFLVSTLGFDGISQILEPILIICYPALIVLAVLNIAHKIAHVQTVKFPFALATAASIVSYFWPNIKMMMS